MILIHFGVEKPLCMLQSGQMYFYFIELDETLNWPEF